MHFDYSICKNFILWIYLFCTVTKVYLAIHLNILSKTVKRNIDALSQ